MSGPPAALVWTEDAEKWGSYSVDNQPALLTPWHIRGMNPGYVYIMTNHFLEDVVEQMHDHCGRKSAASLGG